MTSPYEAWITSFVTNLSEHLNLAGWRFEIEYSDEAPRKLADGNAEYMRIDITYPYLMATLSLSSLVKKDYDEGDFERVTLNLLHEMTHVFLDPFQNWMQPHLSTVTCPIFVKTLEEQTQKLTMVLLKTLPPSVIPPRPKKHGKHNSAPADDQPSSAVRAAGPADVRSERG